MSNGGSISDSKNEGSITGETNGTWVGAGGIIGYAGGVGTNSISSCYNNGEVIGNKIGVGGIAGYFGYETTNSALMVDYCYNIGSFTSGSYRAAIVGRGGGQMSIQRSYFLVGPAHYYGSNYSNGGNTTLPIGDLNSQKMCEQLGEKFKYKDSNGNILDYPQLYWE